MKVFWNSFDWLKGIMSHTYPDVSTARYTTRDSFWRQHYSTIPTACKWWACECDKEYKQVVPFLLTERVQSRHVAVWYRELSFQVLAVWKQQQQQKENSRK